MAFIAEVKKLTEMLGPHKTAAVQVWIDGLEATKRVQAGRDVWEDVPDWKERRENANMIVAYLEGKPVELQVQASGSFEDLGTILERYRSTPEGMKLLHDVLGAEVDLDSLQSGPSVTSPERPREDSVVESEASPDAQK